MDGILKSFPGINNFKITFSFRLSTNMFTTFFVLFMKKQYCFYFIGTVFTLWQQQQTASELNCTPRQYETGIICLL
jgi:hypothetical protein